MCMEFIVFMLQLGYYFIFYGTMSMKTCISKNYAWTVAVLHVQSTAKYSGLMLHFHASAYLGYSPHTN